MPLEARDMWGWLQDLPLTANIAVPDTQGSRPS
jgi:hypothetical protein